MIFRDIKIYFSAIDKCSKLGHDVKKCIVVEHLARLNGSQNCANGSNGTNGTSNGTNGTAKNGTFNGIKKVG